MNISTREITSAIASGDTRAFEHLFRDRFDGMYAEARRVTGKDEAFCLDVVQDAMIRVIRSMKPMNDDAQLRNWLCVVVRTCAYDRLRKDTRRRRRERESVDARAENAVEDGKQAERLAWLERELKTLDEPEARLLVLRFQLGWTLERIGRVLGLKTGAVDGRLGRLVGSLRRRARERYDE